MNYHEVIPIKLAQIEIARLIENRNLEKLALLGEHFATRQTCIELF